MLQPLSASQWDFAASAHLMNRAGFGGAPAQIEGLRRMGPDAAVSLLLDYERIADSTPDPAWAKPDLEQAARMETLRQASPEERKKLQQEEQRLRRGRMMELRGWWLERMARGPRPFQEKMTLFWHGHFATSVEKAREPYFMWRQNELFRRLAAGNWFQLLFEVSRDPAMLVWLDQAQSRKEHPNENFARELMELFTLGEGHYTEKDVTEAARALTGWSLDRANQRFVERPMWHDEGNKTVLGRAGNLDGRDVLEQIVAQPQAALFITAKLWNFFAGQPPSVELNAALAGVFRGSGNNFKPLLRVMFRCEEFYEPSVIRSQVKSPVQWLVGTVRMLEREMPPPEASWNLTRNLGQDLFAPPNVKGWDGGLAWITTNNLLSRYNEAITLVRGGGGGMAGANPNRNPQGERAANRPLNGEPLVNVEKIFTEGERAEADALVAALEKRLLQSKLRSNQEKALRQFLASRDGFGVGDILGAIRLVMSTPEYQLT